MVGKLSKVFLRELAKEHEVLEELDDPVTPKGKKGTATLETSKNAAGVTTEITTTYELQGNTSPQRRKNASALVSRKVARRLLSEFNNGYSDTKGKDSLASVAKRLAGATRIGRKRTSSKQISYALGGTSDFEDDTEEVSSTLLEVKNGKKRRQATMRPVLQNLMKEYIVKEMTKQGAPLKFRTGRFANSAKITSMGITKGGKKDTLSLVYTYMVRPYSVFDPNVSKYQGLSNKGRNPQRIIGQALQNSAKDLISRRYNIKIRQR